VLFRSLFRTRLFRLSPDHHVLVLVIHHAICDGISLGVFDSELKLHYESRSAVAPLPFQYADVSRAQHEAWERGEFAADIGYWKRQLDRLPPPAELPTDRVPGAAAHAYEKAVAVDFAEDLMADLTRYANKHGATVFNVLLAGFVALLHRYTGATDIAIGTPVPGRRSPQLMGMIGMFGNTVLLRVDAAGNPSFGELVDRVRDVTMAALEHQYVPFEKVVEAVRADGTAGRRPLFSVLFEYHRAWSRTRTWGDVAVTNFDLRFVEQVLQDLVVTVGADTGGTNVAISFAGDRYDDDIVERHLHAWQTLLRNAMRDPERGIRDIDTVGAREREAILRLGNGGRRAYPESTLDGLFHRRAGTDPSAVAVRTLERDVSYGELDRESDRIAALLTAYGVGPGDVVAVCMTRTPAMLAALIAVLKTRATYLPLDPGYPADRLGFLLSDSGAGLVVAEESTRDAVAGHRIVLVDAPSPPGVPRYRRSDGDADDPA